MVGLARPKSDAIDPVIVPFLLNLWKTNNITTFSLFLGKNGGAITFGGID